MTIHPIMPLISSCVAVEIMTNAPASSYTSMFLLLLCIHGRIHTEFMMQSMADSSLNFHPLHRASVLPPPASPPRMCLFRVVLQGMSS